MSGNGTALTIYWSSGKVTEVSLPDPVVKDPNAVTTEVDFMLDDLTDGLFVNISNHYIDPEGQEEGSSNDGYLKPFWKPLVSIRLFSPEDLQEMDCITYNGDIAVANLDGTIYSLMRINRLAERYLDSCSALSAYNLISKVAQGIEAVYDVGLDEEGLAKLSDVMGLDTKLILRARSVSNELDGLNGGEDADRGEVKHDVAHEVQAATEVREEGMKAFEQEAEAESTGSTATAIPLDSFDGEDDEWI